MYGFTVLVVCENPWRIVPAKAGEGFRAFNQVKKFGRPTSLLLIALLHPLLRYPYWTVRWNIGRVKTLVPKLASA
jgi:hypothetical protein